MESLDQSWVREKFKGYSVAFGLQIHNASALKLEKIESYLHYGILDDGYGAPNVIESGDGSLIVARNYYGYPTGSSGILMFRVGDTQYHFFVCWSGPRNFYTHSNTLVVGLTAGLPVQVQEYGYTELFNKLYYGTDKLFFNRYKCDFGTGTKQGSFNNRNFRVDINLSQEHKSMNVVTFKENNVRLGRDLPSEHDFDMQKVRVKLVTHSYRGAWSRRTKEKEDEKNHVALVLEPSTKKHINDDHIWLLELAGKPMSKRDIKLTDEAIPTFRLTTKQLLKKERFGLNMKTYNMGEILFSKEDISYFVHNIVQVNSNENLETRCYSWLKQMAALLNLPNQDVIDVARDMIVAQEAILKVPAVPETYDGEEGMMPGTEAFHIFNPRGIVANEKIKTMECDI